MDQGVIVNLKTKYRKIYVRKEFIPAMDEVKEVERSLLSKGRLGSRPPCQDFQLL